MQLKAIVNDKHSSKVSQVMQVDGLAEEIADQVNVYLAMGCRADRGESKTRQDRPAIRKAFQRLIAREPNISSAEAARRLKLSYTTLRNICPDLCDKIADRQKQKLLAKRRFLDMNGQAVVRELTREFFYRGDAPRWTRIRAVMPSYLELKSRRSQEYKQAWLDECAQLGYTPRLNSLASRVR